MGSEKVARQAPLLGEEAGLPLNHPAGLPPLPRCPFRCKAESHHRTARAREAKTERKTSTYGNAGVPRGCRARASQVRGPRSRGAGRGDARDSAARLAAGSGSRPRSGEARKLCKRGPHGLGTPEQCWGQLTPRGGWLGGTTLVRVSSPSAGGRIPSLSIFQRADSCGSTDPCKVPVIPRKENVTREIISALSKKLRERKET